jgi:transcriptional regulator with XRE-family HTH domain
MTLYDQAASIVLEQARESRGMPKAELARRAGISERSVKYYLNGERAMTLGAFRALLAVLGIGNEQAAHLIESALAALQKAEK